MRLPYLTLLCLQVALCQTAPPIIDVHLDATSAAAFGVAGTKACPGDLAKTWPAANPRSLSVTADQLETCPNPLSAARTEDEALAQTRRLMEKYNVTGVVSGPEDSVRRWAGMLGPRAIPGLRISKAGELPLDHLRAQMESKAVRVLGEVRLQYAGLSPADPSFEPYWRLAEENDIPVGIHMGPGLAGEVDYRKQKQYRVSLNDPVLLEEVLVRHPRLRVYVMQAGWPMIDRMIQMLHAYPRLHVDTGLISWYLPRPEFHQYLRRLVDAGFGSRILFGSGQMVWPQALEVAIQGIESADFLTPGQKRDIFHNNAVRFLGIETVEDVRKFWDSRFSKPMDNVSSSASRLLLEYIANRKPGAALDLGMGEGRNALYLAVQGWTVTGVDISPVAVAKARQAAAARSLKLEAVADDLDAYDFGKERWDLMTSFYMQDWHANSRTDIPARIYDALRPGGLVIIEGFGPPRLRATQLAKGFARMKILLNETITTEPEWGKGQQRTIVRFVAEKPR